MNRLSFLVAVLWRLMEAHRAEQKSGVARVADPAAWRRITAWLEFADNPFEAGAPEGPNPATYCLVLQDTPWGRAIWLQEWEPQNRGPLAMDLFLDGTTGALNDKGGSHRTAEGLEHTAERFLLAAILAAKFHRDPPPRRPAADEGEPRFREAGDEWWTDDWRTADWAGRAPQV